MKLVFAAWLLQGILYVTAGYGFLFAIQQAWNRFRLENFPIGQVVLVGAGVVTGLLQVFQLFLPVGGIALRLGVVLTCVLISFGVALSGAGRVQLREAWALGPAERALKSRFFLVALVAIPVFYAALIPIRDYDAGLYHVQTIQWLKEFAIVPGLGNLHGRFAHNSSSFLLNAFWDFGSLTNRSYHLVNGVLFLGLIDSIVYLCLSASTVVPFAFCLGWLTIAARDSFPSFISLYQPNEVAFFYLIAALTSLFCSNFSGKSAQKSQIVPGLFFLVFAVTVKLYVIPYLLLVPLLWLCETKEMRRGVVVISAISAAALLLPWLVRSVIVSGWLIYPLPVLNVFPFDWKIPKENVASMSAWIRSWAFVPKTYPDQVFAQGSLRAIGDWVGRNWRQGPYFWLLCWYAVASLGVAVMATAGRLKERRLIGLMGFMLVPLAFFLYSAPVWRLGRIHIEATQLLSQVTLLALVLGLPLGFLKRLRASPPPRVHAGKWVLVVGMLLGTVGAATPRAIRSGAAYSQNLPGVPKAGVVPIKLPSGLTVYEPTKGDQCWDAPLPCRPPHFIYLCLPGPTEIAPRGSSLASGFRVVKQEQRRADLSKLWNW